MIDPIRRDHDDDPTPPGGAIARHPHDPRPLAEQFDRCHDATRPVGHSSQQIEYLQSLNHLPWRPAPWHFALLHQRAGQEHTRARAA
jgi:hypothetical protein